MPDYNQAVKLWQSYKIQKESDIDLRLDSFKVLFAYNSGKIENTEITYHDTREIFENGKVVGFSGDPRTIFEIENQKKCYEYLKPLIIRREPITIEFIKEVHRILTAGTYSAHRYEQGERSGEFKKHDYVTGINEVGAAPDEVESEISEMLDVLSEHEDSSPLKLATYFHARFEYIHPFADGNGRVGRTLMNYYLMTHNHPPIIIYDEDKKLYYAALEQYDISESLDSLHSFLKNQTIKTWTKALERNKGIEI